MNQQQQQGSIQNNWELQQDGQVNEIDTQINLEVAYTWLTSALLLVVLFNSFLSLLLSSLTFGLSFRIPLLFLSVVHLIYLIKVCVVHNKTRAKTDFDCCFEMTWSIGLISYYSCLIYFVEYHRFQIQYLGMMLCIYNAIWMFYSGVKLHKKKSEKQQFKLLGVFAKLCFVIQITFINLKLIDWLAIHWLYAFVLIWLFLFVAIFLELISLFNLSAQINKYFSSNNVGVKVQMGTKIIGLFWICLFFLSFAGVPTYTMINLCIYLEEEQGRKNYLLAIIISVFYTIIYMAYTIYHKELLTLFILNLHYFSHINEDRNQDRHILSFPSSRSQKKFIYSLKENMNNKNNIQDYPQQMIKISSTYYLPDELVMKRHQTEVNNNMISNKQSTITEVAVQETTIKQCFNCFQRQSCVVYMPCGHGGMCQECALKWYEQNKECPICRSNIKAILQIEQIDEQTVKVIEIIAQN
ncbi:unnamed protein product [Paramecium sonneborni]|uniref:RING-type domain-containing protein n=1 Tax=Paramecium sonneborni TaxID=65129 RepID=A0A8S1RMS4_9CILI|nr:unnamed protein product [Paramecium sonneborni]